MSAHPIVKIQIGPLNKYIFKLLFKKKKSIFQTQYAAYAYDTL